MNEFSFASSESASWWQRLQWTSSAYANTLKQHL